MEQDPIGALKSIEDFSYDLISYAAADMFSTATPYP